MPGPFPREEVGLTLRAQSGGYQVGRRGALIPSSLQRGLALRFGTGEFRLERVGSKRNHSGGSAIYPLLHGTACPRRLPESGPSRRGGRGAGRLNIVPGHRCQEPLDGERIPRHDVLLGSSAVLRIGSRFAALERPSTE